MQNLRAEKLFCFIKLFFAPPLLLWYGKLPGITLKIVQTGKQNAFTGSTSEKNKIFVQ